MTPLRILANPCAGRGRRGDATAPLRELARRHGAELRWPDTVDALLAETRGAVEEGVPRLAVAGGDGTLHRVAGELAGSDTALAVLPRGTGNDFARALGVPLDLERAARVAVAGTVRTLDLGRVDGRAFLTVAGAGFHGAVAHYANVRARFVRGPAVYPWAVLRTLGRYEPPFFRVRYDGGRYEDRAWMVLLANTAWFGGGMRVAPGADPEDGRLELVIVRAIGRAALLRVFPRVYRGSHVGHPAVVLASTRGATIEIDRSEVWYADGEPLTAAGTGSARVTVEARRLRVVGGSEGG